MGPAERAPLEKGSISNDSNISIQQYAYLEPLDRVLARGEVLARRRECHGRDCLVVTVLLQETLRAIFQVLDHDRAAERVDHVLVVWMQNVAILNGACTQRISYQRTIFSEKLLSSRTGIWQPRCTGIGKKKRTSESNDGFELQLFDANGRGCCGCHA